MLPPSESDAYFDDTTMPSNDSFDIGSKVHVCHLPLTFNIFIFDIHFAFIV